MQIVDNKFILHPKSMTVLVCFFLLNKKTCWIRRHIRSIAYPYINMQEGPSDYFSLNMNDYTDVQYFIENNGFVHL